MQKERPTLKDVAARSGLGLRTVKKVMSGDPTVREKNRDAILTAARELSYTPNRAASALSMGRLYRLALVFPLHTDLYYTQMQQGFVRAQEELLDYGLQLEYFTTSTLDWREQQTILQQLLQWKDLDGIVLQPVSTRKLNAEIDALIRSGKPVVTFGTDAPESKRLCYVSCDAWRAGRIAAQMLSLELPQGAAVIAITLGMDGQQSMERVRGFQARLRETRPDLSLTILEVPSARYAEQVRSLVTERSNTGFFCADAYTTVTAKIMRELGRSDLPLVGFDLSDSTAELMKQGYLRAVLDQKPELHAYYAVKYLFQYLSEHRIPDPIIYEPVYILTSECL